MAENTVAHHMCETCGAETTGTGYLCRPFKSVKLYVCEYCGEETDAPRHMCYPQIEHLNREAGQLLEPQPQTSFWAK